MQVGVEDHLTGIGAGVEHKPVALIEAFLRSHLGSERDERVETTLRRGLGRIDPVPAGDDQEVGGRLRMQVTEGDRLVVAADHLGRDVPGDDLAEQAVRI